LTHLIDTLCEIKLLENDRGSTSGYGVAADQDESARKAPGRGNGICRAPLSSKSTPYQKFIRIPKSGQFSVQKKWKDDLDESSWAREWYLSPSLFKVSSIPEVHINPQKWPIIGKTKWKDDQDESSWARERYLSNPSSKLIPYQEFRWISKSGRLSVQTIERQFCWKLSCVGTVLDEVLSQKSI